MTDDDDVNDDDDDGDESSWDRIELDAVDDDEPALLSINGKEDEADASRTGVRGGRFCDSFLMATNGGATYEDALRPHAEIDISVDEESQPAQPPIPQMPPDDNMPELQNVHGRDDRRLIRDTSRIPARSIGLAKISMANGATRYGTAWLIGPRTLATAAHNLLHPTAGPAARLDVGLAYDGRRARGGWHRVIDNHFPAVWRRHPGSDNPYDFAVLKIANANVGNRLGWLGFADYEDGKFANMILNVIGYPMDLIRYHLYGSAGRVTGIQENRIFFDCDAGPGMSGGPVIARFGEHRIAVGIHVAGGYPSNVGTRINDTAHGLLKKFRSW